MSSAMALWDSLCVTRLSPCEAPFSFFKKGFMPATVYAHLQRGGALCVFLGRVEKFDAGKNCIF